MPIGKAAGINPNDNPYTTSMYGGLGVQPSGNLSTQQQSASQLQQSGSQLGSQLGGMKAEGVDTSIFQQSIAKFGQKVNPTKSLGIQPGRQQIEGTDPSFAESVDKFSQKNPFASANGMSAFTGASTNYQNGLSPMGSSAPLENNPLGDQAIQNGNDKLGGKLFLYT